MKFCNLYMELWIKQEICLQLGFPDSSDGKVSACNAKIWIWFLGWGDPLEEGMATHSSILAWKIPINRGAWQTIVHGVVRVRDEGAMKHRTTNTSSYMNFILHLFYFSIFSYTYNFFFNIFSDFSFKCQHNAFFCWFYNRFFSICLKWKHVNKLSICIP